MVKLVWRLGRVTFEERRMLTRIQSGALAAMALLMAAAATPSAAGTVAQTRSIDHHQSLTTNLLDYNVSDDDAFSLHFDAFDASLGVLTNVQWTLNSTRHYEVGISTVGGEANYLAGNDAATSVSVGGMVLGLGDPIGPQGPIACYAHGAPFCLFPTEDNDAFNFDVAVANLLLYGAPGGVDAALSSRLSLNGVVFGDSVISATAASSLDWVGDLTLTYTYQQIVGPPPVHNPGSVPEPASWALMIMGFGLSGSLLRRRARRVAGT